MHLDNFSYETSHEEIVFTHEDDSVGEFHLTIKNQIINR